MHIPRKRFGQHFLVDMGVLDAMIQAIRPTQDDVMLEIGPGLGAMTDLLVEHLSCLHVVELDRDLAAKLRKRYSPQRLIVHEQDVLQFDFVAWAKAQKKPVRIVGNLPYNISTPLLFHLLSIRDCVVDQHFMLQKEVVDRMVANPSTSGYGRLSVMLQLYYQMASVFDVPPSAFDPPPRVDSAIVRMQPYIHPKLAQLDTECFATVVSSAFSQRRKMLRNTLSSLLQPIDPAILAKHLSIDLTKRAEDLSLDDYIDLCLLIQQHGRKQDQSSCT